MNSDQDQQPIVELIGTDEAPTPNTSGQQDLRHIVKRRPSRQIVSGSWAHRSARFGLPTAVAILAILAVYALPIIEGRLLTRVIALAVVLWGLDLQLGLGGQLSLGHGAFVGVGAYTTAITMGQQGWPFPAALAAAALAGLVAGALVGLPSLRIQGQYLAMVTLGFAVAFPHIIQRFGWLTGGIDGPRIDYQFIPPSWLQLQARHYYRWSHAIICLLALLVFFFVRGVISGPLGRQIRAAADNPASATAFGLRVGAIRVHTVALSGSVAAVGGALLVFETPIVTAASFDLLFSLTLYAVAIFGGIGTMGGGILGALLLIGSPWLVSHFGLRMEPALIAGVLLVGFTLMAPQGLVGVLMPRLSERYQVIDKDFTPTH